MSRRSSSVKGNATSSRPSLVMIRTFASSYWVMMPCCVNVIGLIRRTQYCSLDGGHRHYGGGRPLGREKPRQDARDQRGTRGQLRSRTYGASVANLTVGPAIVFKIRQDSVAARTYV